MITTFLGSSCDKTRLFAAVLLLVAGCRKENSVGLPIITADRIVYTDVSPDSLVTSVRAWFSYPWCYCSMPIPQDSSASIAIDADHDDTTDLEVWVSTYYYPVSASNPDANYNYFSGIGFPAGKGAAAVTGVPCYNYGNLKFFAADSVVSGTCTYYKYGYLYLDVNYMPCCSIGPPSGDQYVGFRLPRNHDFIYGWILLRFSAMKLTIMEYAVNLTPNQPIRAGQKQLDDLP